MSAARGLFIPAAVLALPGLTLTARLVLAEVLNLHQVAGNVFARDSHFANRLNVGVRTVGTAIAELETQGYLARPYDPTARQKRSLVPTEKCLPIQQGEVADSATSIAECLPIQQPLPSECLPIQQVEVADSADINNILNKTTHSLADGEGASASAPLSALSSVEQLSQQPADKPGQTMGAAPAEVPSPAAPRASRPTRKREATAPAAPPELLPDSCRLAALLNPGGLAAQVQRMKEPLTPAQVGKLLADYGEGPVHDILCEMANWPKLLTNAASANLTARNWLGRRGIRPGTGSESAPPAAGQPAAAPSTTYDVAALFGLDSTLTAERALARNRETPEYKAYQARRLAEAQIQGNTTPTP